jgi:hypothetical protein
MRLIATALGGALLTLALRSAAAGADTTPAAAPIPAPEGGLMAPGFAAAPAAKPAAKPTATPAAKPAANPADKPADASATAQPAPPVVAAPAEPAKAPPPGPEWGVLARGGYFGLPNLIADKLFRQHPAVNGSIYGAEFRSHGAGGARGIASVGYAVDHGSAEADGIWQAEPTSKPVAGKGNIEFTAFTVTGYLNILPSFFLHPYVGLGIGAGYYTGMYRKDNDIVRVKSWMPVLTLPLGLTLEISRNVNLSAEARFIDGIQAGGAIQALF